MKPAWMTAAAVIAALLGTDPAAADNVVNADMTFNASQVFDTGDDYFFNNNASSTWQINNGAVVTMPQSSSAVGERFFVGVDDGNTGTLTFTSTAGGPGQLSARGNTYAAMRIGHTTGNSSGIVNVEGGVNVDVGWIFGDGNGTRQLNVRSGRFNVMSDNAAKRLNGIDVTVGVNGTLWVEGTTTGKSHFQSSYAPGATLTANGGQLYFRTAVGYDPIAGSPQTGTLITVRDVAPRPADADLMVVSTHPDDEGIFFGGTLPYYTQVLKAKTVHVSMTSGDWGRSPEVREEELRNADWVYGLRSEPVFPRFKDVPTQSGSNNGGYPNSIDATWDWWNDGELDGYGTPGEDAAAGRQRAIDALATYIRTYKPEVIVTHDLDGEYGHDNHKATAIAVVEAYSQAADPAYVDGLEPWQSEKLYLHLHDQNRLFHDYWEATSIDTSGDGVADMTPRMVADLGLDEHISQGSPGVSTVYRDGENYDAWPSEWWGLYASTVGPDTVADPFVIEGTTYVGWARSNFFEHVTTVPEPSALLLTAVGLLVLASYGRRWRGRACC